MDKGLWYPQKRSPQSLAKSTHYCNRLATTTTNIIMACRDIEIDFIVQDNNPEMASVEDDIVENLKEIGIKVNTRVSLTHQKQWCNGRWQLYHLV